MAFKAAAYCEQKVDGSDCEQRYTHTSKMSISKIVFVGWGFGVCGLGSLIFKMAIFELTRNRPIRPQTPHTPPLLFSVKSPQYFHSLDNSRKMVFSILPDMLSLYGKYAAVEI